ncbi:MAG: DinB family protein [Terriglobales bacterium]
MPKKKTTPKKRTTTKKSLAISARRSAAPPDKSVREQVLYLLGGGGAHVDFDHALGDWPVQLAGVKVANFPHTAWMLLEHMRIAQWDILEFSRNPRHASPSWPEGYWPTTEAPPSEKAWEDSAIAYKKNLRAMEQLVANSRTDIFAKLPWGDGQTILREALLVADHNAYHLGQLVTLRKCIGI